jgi:small subunit ribosomal protein S6
MKNRYEALLVLDTAGKEETVNKTVERLSKEFEKEGAVVEQVQRLEKREFAYAAGHLDSGYYVNVVFEGEPEIIEKLNTKFRLDADVYRQNYQKLPAKKVVAGESSE